MLGIILYIVGVMPTYVVLGEFIESSILRIVIGIVIIGLLTALSSSKGIGGIIGTLAEIGIAIWAAVIGWNHYHVVFAVVLSLYALLMVVWFVLVCISVAHRE